MTLDVLAYNSLNAGIKTTRTLSQALTTCNTNLTTEVSQKQSCVSTINTEIASLQASVDANLVNIIANSGPNRANLWCLIPEGSGWTNGFKVCGTQNSFNLGFCCAWTVPAGVTCARFQLWGAGAGTGSSCCCGFSTIGGTGAYASVIMPVTAGNTYTICSGCAFCCYPLWSSSANGCPSYVTGTGLSNFCAEGGRAGMCCEGLTRGLIGAACGFFGCFINSGSDVCWNTPISSLNYRTDTRFPFISSCSNFFGSATGGTVFGVRGSYGFTQITNNISTLCVVHPPIYGFASTSCCNCNVAFNYRGGFCRSACVGFMQIPGAGGWAGYKCGGQTSSPCGDMGRMGMVCVCFK